MLDSIQSPYKSKGEPRARKQTVQTGLSDNAASGLAYVTFIPAIVFLVTAPYNQNQRIRFPLLAIDFPAHCLGVIVDVALVIVE